MTETDVGMAETDVGMADTDVGMTETDVGMTETDVGMTETDLGMTGFRPFRRPPNTPRDPWFSLSKPHWHPVSTSSTGDGTATH